MSQDMLPEEYNRFVQFCNEYDRLYPRRFYSWLSQFEEAEQRRINRIEQVACVNLGPELFGRILSFMYGD